MVAIIGKLDPKTDLEVDPRSEVDGEWWISKKWNEVLQRRKP